MARAAIAVHPPAGRSGSGVETGATVNAAGRRPGYRGEECV